MNHRRIGVVVTLLLALLVMPLAAETQPGAKIPQIGFLRLGHPHPTSRFWDVWRQSLREMGYVDGHTIIFVERYAERQADRLAALAAELVRLNVDVIVVGDTPAIHAAIRATTTIPIVMLTVGDPVESRFVESLARPSGNVTGVGGLVLELNTKLLELLKEAMPEVTRMAVLVTPAGLARSGPEMQAAAQALGVQLHFLEVRGADEFESALNAATRESAGALLILPAPLFALNERRLAALAAKSRLPAIFWRRPFAEAGGLLSYGPSLADNWRRAAVLVGKILQGAKPADLPVERPTKFELVINLKTAQALGLTIPPTILFQADEVIR